MRLCIAVLTEFTHLQHRMIIRETWFKNTPRQVSQFFVVGFSDGRRMKVENKTYVDIIATVSEDPKLYLDLKTLSFVENLKHENYTHFLFVDDDTYPRVDWIYAELEQLKHIKYLGYGGVEYFSYNNNSGEFKGWGGSMKHAQNVRPKNKALSSPFPFLKGPLMLYSSNLLYKLIESQSITRMRQYSYTILHKRIILDGFFGYLISNLDIAKHVYWHSIGVCRSNQNSHMFRGFAEMRWGRNLSHPISCLTNIHFGNTRLHRMARVSRNGGILFHKNEIRMNTTSEVFSTAAKLIYNNNCTFKRVNKIRIKNVFKY